MGDKSSKLEGEGQEVSISKRDEMLREFLTRNKSTKTQLAKHFGLSTGIIGRSLSRISRSQSNSRLRRETAGDSRQVFYSCDNSLESIVEESPYNLPETSINSPFEIAVKDQNDYRLGLIGTIYAGGQCDTKLVRNAFKYFNDEKTDAVIIAGGNVGWLDLTRYSKYKPDRAGNSRIAINPSMVGYPDAIKSAGRDPKALLDEQKPIYVTFKERFDMLLTEEIKPLFLDEKSEPIYKGPIYLTFGDIEEELARAHANIVVKAECLKEKTYCNTMISKYRAEARTEERTLKTQQKEFTKKEEGIEAKIKALNEDIAESKAEEEKNKFKTSLFEYQSELKKTQGEHQGVVDAIEQHISAAEENVNVWSEYRDRIMMSNTDWNFIKRAFEQMKGYIIEKVENAIPNCKVLATGTCFIKAGDQIGKIVPSANKNSASPSENLMDRLEKAESTALHQGESSPDFVIGGGLSPNFTYQPKPICEAGGEKTVSLIQLATCLDTVSLEKIVSSQIKIAGVNLAKIATKDDLRSGAVVMQYLKDDKGRTLPPIMQVLREEFLRNDEVMKKPEGSNKEPLFYEIMWSDQHNGSKYMALTETETDVIPTFKVAQQMLREMRVPAVRINFVGDENQELNYDTHLEDHPDHLEATEIGQKIKRLLADPKMNPEQSKIAVEKLRKRNDYRAGIIPPDRQLMDFIVNLDKDLLSRVIENADKSGFYGPSLLFINGNHNAHTADGMYITSVLLAFALKYKLGRPEEEVICGKSLTQRIMAPMLGSEGIYSGLEGIAPGLALDTPLKDVIKYNDNYLYAEYLRHKMKGKKRGDHMKGQREAFSARGQHDANIKGRFFTTISGHDHLGGITMSKHGMHVRSYCFMERNAYGDKYDFGEPSIGYICVGKPVGGIDQGPVVITSVMKDYIDHYARNKPKIPVEKMFKNSIVKPE